jgi:tripartite-type tricarboxylate transporter receptor subunit TctC
MPTDRHVERFTMLNRRHFLRLAGAAAALPALSRVAAAQAYPSHPVRLVSGFPAGGFSDLIGRLSGQWLAERLGQPFILENRPGAGSNIGTEAVVRAAPDGHTLLMVTAANAVNASFYGNLKYDFIHDIAPVVGIVTAPYVMLVNPSLPARTVAEFIAQAKANPGKILMAAAGNGSSLHMSGELFKMLTGVDLAHVPYRGETPALTDVIAGHAQVVFASAPGSIEYIRAGSVRALGVTTTKRSASLPDVPTIGETVPGYEALGWIGFGAPHGTPAAIIETLNAQMNAALSDAGFKAHITNFGAAAFGGSADDFARHIAAETAKWAKVVKFSGAKPS